MYVFVLYIIVFKNLTFFYENVFFLKKTCFPNHMNHEKVFYLVPFPSIFCFKAINKLSNVKESIIHQKENPVCLTFGALSPPACAVL